MFSKLRDIPIAVKVTLWYTLFMGIIFALVMGFTVKFTEDMHLAGAHSAIEEKLSEVQRKPHKLKGYDDGVYLIEFNNANEVVKGTLPPGMKPVPPDFKKSKLQILKTAGDEYHYYDRRLDQNTWLRGVVVRNRIVQHSQKYLLGLLAALPLFIILAALGGYKIIKRGFKPVEQISATVKNITETSDLSRRVEVGQGRDELHTMAATFNTMLDKVEGSLQREKQFSSDVSHELRTPVSVIMSESEFAKDYTQSVEEAKSSFATIYKQAQHMAALISQILELARMENKGTIETQKVDYTALVQEIFQEYKILADKKQLTFTAAIAENIFVAGNPNLLRRALANYLDNGLKFTNSRLGLTLSTKGTKAVIAVEDDGLGMAPEVLTQIWHRLYQENTSRNKSQQKGLGLGLALVTEIMKLHQGRAYAESMLGQGSKFFLELPLKS